MGLVHRGYRTGVAKLKLLRLRDYARQRAEVHASPTYGHRQRMRVDRLWTSPVEDRLSEMMTARVALVQALSAEYGWSWRMALDRSTNLHLPTASLEALSVAVGALTGRQVDLRGCGTVGDVWGRMGADA